MQKLLLSFSLVVVLATPTLAFAEDGSNSHDSIEKTRQTIQQNLQKRELELKEKVASKEAEIKDKLDATRLKVCQTRQSIITKRSEKIANRANTQFTVFGSIATRVEDYYTNKLLTKGVTVPNYDILVADVTAQKQGAQEAITAAQTAATAVDCSSDNPKAEIADFNSKMKLAIEALQDYRTSIKNLIISIKESVAAETATESAK